MTSLTRDFHLAGIIRPSIVRTGPLSLRYPDPIPEELIDQIFTTSFDLAEKREFEYEKMERAGLPPLGLPHDVFCPNLLRDHPGLDGAFTEELISFKKGHPVPVLAARATFIPGGLFLSVYSNHSVVDGSGIARIYQVLSVYIRCEGQAETPNLSLVLSTSPNSDYARNVDLDFQRRSFDSLAKSTESIGCLDFRYPATPPRAPALRSIPYNLVAKILSFRHSQYQMLRRFFLPQRRCLYKTSSCSLPCSEGTLALLAHSTS